MVDLPFESIEQGAALVLSLGDGVRVVVLRALVHQLALAVARQHAAEEPGT